MTCVTCASDEICEMAPGASVRTCEPAPPPVMCSVTNTGLEFLDSCTDNTLCRCADGFPFCPDGSGECGDAFGATYFVGLVTLTLPDRDPAGNCWGEPVCLPPDPYVVIELDGVEVGRTPPEVMTYTIDWTSGMPMPFSVDVTVNEGATLRLSVFDADAGGMDQFAIECTFRLTAVLLRTRMLICDDARGTLLVAGVGPR